VGGNCEYPTAPDGTTCGDDGNACTIDACVGGNCPNAAAPDGTACPAGVCCGGGCTDCCSEVDCPDGGGECQVPTCLDGECGIAMAWDNTACSGGVCCGGTCCDGWCDWIFGCIPPTPGGTDCGSAVFLPFETPVTGDTTGMGNDISGMCTGGDESDVTYSFSLGEDSLFYVLFDPLYGDFGGVASIRTDCADAGTEAVCGHHLDLLTCLPAGDYVIVIDGGAPDHERLEGPYRLFIAAEACPAGDACIDGVCATP
jgi:hypothetical protein